MELQVGQSYKANYRGKVIELKVLKKNKKSYTVSGDYGNKTLWAKINTLYFIEYKSTWSGGYNEEIEIEILTDKEAEKLNLENKIKNLKARLERYNDKITVATNKIKNYKEELDTYTRHKASAEKEKIELEEKLKEFGEGSK